MNATTLAARYARAADAFLATDRPHRARWCFDQRARLAETLAHLTPTPSFVAEHVELLDALEAEAGLSATPAAVVG